MNLTGLSLKSYLADLAGDFSEHQAGIYVFSMLRDFYPHAEIKGGDCPLYFSFRDEWKHRKDWFEIQDGLILLMPYLFGDRSQNSKVVLPPVSRFFNPNPAEDLLYSSIESRQDQDIDKNNAIVFLDFFSEIHTLIGLEKRRNSLAGICNQYEKVEIYLNSHHIPNKVISESHHFFNFIRTLPANCQIISADDFFPIHNFNFKEVIFLYDQDFVTKSPWEEWSAVMNAFIKPIRISPADEMVQSFQLAPGVSKQIFRHKFDKKEYIDEEMILEIKAVLQMIKSKDDLLNPSYIRLMNDLIVSRMKGL